MQAILPTVSEFRSSRFILLENWPVGRIQDEEEEMYYDDDDDDDDDYYYYYYYYCYSLVIGSFSLY
jgi:hypothetical protein